MVPLFFSPSGRINRGKWWLGQLLLVAIGCVYAAVVVSFVAPNGDITPDALSFLIPLLMFLPVLIWMGFSLTAKRYHDVGKSAWWFLIGFIPIIGPIWQLIECGFVSGEAEDNDYGPGSGMNIAEDLEALAAPGALGSKQIDFDKYRAYSPRPVAADSSPDAGKPVFGRRV